MVGVSVFNHVFFLRGPSSKKNVGFRGCSSLPLHICVCKPSRSFNGVCFPNHYLISILKEQKSGIVARHVWNTPLQPFLQKRQGLPNSVMQTRGFLILVTEKCLKPKSSHGGSYGVLWDLEDPRHQFWWHSVSDKLTSSRRPWYLLYRLNSQGCVEKFRRAVFPFPFWLACSRSFSGFQDNWKTQFCSKKNEGDQRGKKSGIQFSGHSNSISII